MLHFAARLLASALFSLVVAGIRVASVFRVGRYKSHEKMKPYRWHKVKLDRSCVCADGSKYCMYFNKGKSDNLLISFSGGGMIWDERSAQYPMGVKSYLKGVGFGYYFNRIAAFGLHPMKGIMDNRREENPFKDWSIAYIPYTTGDFHIGNAVRDIAYNGKTRRVHFNGRQNVKAALEQVYAAFETPRKVLVCGESAGAFGSAFYVQEIARHYEKSKVTYLCDSALIKSEKWNGILQMWGADFQQTYGYEPGENIVKAALEDNGRQLMGRVAQLYAISLYDNVLSEFAADINGADKKDGQYIKTWSQEMRSSVREMAERIPNFHYFISRNEYNEKDGTTPHVMARFERYYKYEEEGKRYDDWVGDAVNEQYRDIGSAYLDADAE